MMGLRALTRRSAIALTMAFATAGAAFASDKPAGGNATLEAAPPSVALMGVGLYSNDLDRSIAFYRDGLGMKEVRRLQFETIDEVIMGFGGDATMPLILLLQRRDKVAEPLPTADARKDKLVLDTSDAEALRQRLLAAGYAPEPIDANPALGVKVFWVSDPDGYRYEITERRR